jgi:hypothetical protein
VAAYLAGDAGPARSAGGGGRLRCRKGRSWCRRRSPVMQDQADPAVEAAAAAAAAAAVTLDAHGSRCGGGVSDRCTRSRELPSSGHSSKCWAGPNTTSFSFFSHDQCLAGLTDRI